MKTRDKEILISLISELEYLISKVKTWSNETFINDIDAQHIAGMALINIGEMFSSLSDDFVEKYNHLPIHSVIGMRNITAHGYINALDMNIVWNTIYNDVPILLKQLKEI
jgi:uncharacterized protein with HEPN domain